MKYKQFLFLVIFGLLLPLFSFTQITLTLPSLEICPGNFETPVEASNFNDVATLSLVVRYDTTIVAYDGHSDLNPAFNSGFFLINPVSDQVKFTWFSLTPVTLGNTTLLTLHFHHLLNKNTTIIWDDDSLGNCQITDLNGTEINTTLLDAAITTRFKTPALMTPQNNASEVSVNPIFHWNGSGCGPHYYLIYSKDENFLTDTTSLSNIFGTSLNVDSLEFNTTYFWKVRSVINSTPYYTDWSEVFHFTTKQPDGINDVNNQVIILSLCPNPAKNRTTIKYKLNHQAMLDIQLVDITGKKIQQILQETGIPSSYIRDLNTENLGMGIYFVKIIVATSFEISIKSVKLVILR